MDRQHVNLKLLIAGCQEGNRLSQNKLYEKYYGFGLKISMRYGASRSEAAEILNDAFLKVFRKLDQYDHDYPFEAWLKKIIVHQAIDHYRRQLRKPTLVKWKEATKKILYQPAFPDQSEDTDMLRYIQQLPPAYRTTFNLYVMEGYKHHEIAEKLNISSSTSRSNLSRAKELLKKLIKKNKPEVRFR